MSPFQRHKNTAETHLTLQEAAERSLRRPQNTDPDAIILQAVQGRVEIADDMQHDGMKKVQHSPPGAPLPGSQGERPDGVKPHLVTLVTPTAFEAEPYRVLGHLVAQMHKDAGLGVLAISSPSAGDGKTTTAINLAGVLAQEPGARVLLVEAELRRPAMLTYLGLKDAGGKGLVGATLEPALSLERAVHSCPQFNLSVLSAGHSVASPYDVLKLPRFGELLYEALQHYDYIVVDTPPLIPFADCRLIEQWIDGFLVVVAAHKTPPKLLADALHVIDPAKLVGLVLNKDDHLAAQYYQTYRYYSQSPNRHQKGWRPFRRLRGCPETKPL
jgi:capsular exopolysaccharide synthesis family protein